MISRQKQIAVVKQLISRELSSRGVKDSMLQTLSGKGQIASGRLEAVINRMTYAKMVRLAKTVFSEDGFLISFEVVIDFNFAGAPYAKFLDEKESSNKDSYAVFSSQRNIVQNLKKWVETKPISSWRSSVDLSTKKKVKTFVYFLIKDKLKSNKVQNQSDFITSARKNAQAAVDVGTDNFVNYLGEQIVLEHISTLNKSQFF